jgi:L-lactate dehydrogenase complex protein LldE
MNSAEPSSTAAPRVGLFVTCLVDLFRPSVGFAAVKLLEEAGCTVEVPDAQTCCGQPAFNSGDRATTEALVRGLIDAFAGYDYVVAPSGSCAGMLRSHVPDLFEDDPATAGRAKEFAGRCHELVSFLVDVMGMREVPAALERRVTYHDSCSGLRELKVKRQPRLLLESMAGLAVTEMQEPEVCCGFGGTFCVKYPQVSTKMVDNKAVDIEATGADLLLAGDLGCLMNMAGRLARRGSAVEIRHVAEVLAGELDAPPIGRPADA